MFPLTCDTPPWALLRVPCLARFMRTAEQPVEDDGATSGKQWLIRCVATVRRAAAEGVFPHGHACAPPADRARDADGGIGD
ncbi:hypothetical protein GCM10010499_48720 [Streptomyces thermoviolaceus subsp. apingens]|nr:hypothetical protein GCM10010499_48720 [Streptomyces thermoviolaceus subsp. apingens]